MAASAQLEGLVDEPSAWTVIRDHDLHPPDEVRLFPMPKPGVLRLDDRMFVAVVRHGEIVLWHFTFRDHWFKVNATSDLEGGLVETTAPKDVPPVRVQLRHRHPDAATRRRGLGRRPVP